MNIIPNIINCYCAYKKINYDLNFYDMNITKLHDKYLEKSIIYYIQ